MARDGSEWRWVVSSDAPESPTFVGNRTVPVRRLVLVSGGVSVCCGEFGGDGRFRPGLPGNHPQASVSPGRGGCALSPSPGPSPVAVWVRGLRLGPKGR